ncbi:MAG: hypothetical protein ACR2GH_04595 [Pseudonocardia sp.]
MGADLHSTAAPLTEGAPAEAEDEAPIAVRLDGIEVTQAVQDLAHSVPLIAGKQTVVRLYLAAEAGGDRAVTVGGELELQRGGDDGVPPGPARYLPALDTVRLDPATTPDLPTRRGDLELSLNFPLAEADVVAGQLTIRVGRLIDAMVGRRLQLVDRPDVPATLTVRFMPSPPLRLRIVGLRYPSANGTVSPRALDFALLVSWLQRAYPVPRVEHTQIVTELALQPPFSCGQVNAVLAATRNLDVATGTDPRTHYLGLVYDAEGRVFMKGCSSGLPAVADTRVVASAPAGVPRDGFSWDSDGSYADWYGAHELSHTFGRLHPGFGGGQARDDPAFPYPAGQISDGDTFVGFDVGDPSLNLPSRALPGQRWHDVMTYCSDQWICFHTYEGIRIRLAEEDAITADEHGPADVPAAGGASAGDPRAAGAPNPADPGQPLLNVLGRVDLTAGTAEIQLVNPLPAALPEPPEDPESRRVTLRLVNADGASVDQDVAVRVDSSAGEEGVALTGLVDAVVAVSPQLSALELWWGGEQKCRYEIPRVTPREMTPQLEPRPAADAAAGPSASGHRRTLSWPEHEPGTHYNIQVSDDGGASWQTVAVNRAEPWVELDRNQFRSNRLRVRVYATDGVRMRESQLDVDMED